MARGAFFELLLDQALSQYPRWPWLYYVSSYRNSDDFEHLSLCMLGISAIIMDNINLQ